MAKTRGSKKDNKTPRTPKAKAEGGGKIDLEVGPTVNVKDVKLATSNRRTIYQPLFDKIAGLKKEGDGFIVPVKAPMTARTLHNRLNAVMRQVPEKVTLPVGLVVKKSTTTDQQIYIGLAKKSGK